MLGEVHWPATFEVRAGDIVEHQIRLEAEQVTEPAVEVYFDLVFGCVELIECAIPGVQLPGMHADPPVSVPVGNEASAQAIADEVALEPAGQSMFAGWLDESIGDQDEGPVSEGNTFGFAEQGVEDRPESQLVEQGTDDEDWSPVGGIDYARDGRIDGLDAGVSSEEPLKLGEDLDEEIFATEIGDDALLDLAVIAIGFDDADVFVDGAVARANFEGSGIHGNDYHDAQWSQQDEYPRIIQCTNVIYCHYNFRVGGRPPHAQSLETQANSRAGVPAAGCSTPNMG